MRDNIKLVEQTNEYDCGAAALAMILGLSSPGEVERKYLGRECSASHTDRGLVPPAVGVFAEEAQCVLFKAGIPALQYIDLDRCLSDGTWLLRVWDRVRIGNYDLFRKHVGEGGTAMLGVPSLNNADRGHWIVVSGDKVFDPSTNKKYRAWSEVPKLLGAILIGNRARERSAISWVSRLADWLRGRPSW